MKVPKSISIDKKLLEFIKQKRPEFQKRFSTRVETLIRADIMDAKESAVEFKIAETGKKISKLTKIITGFEVERDTLEREMEFLQAKSKKEESK